MSSGICGWYSQASKLRSGAAKARGPLTKAGSPMRPSVNLVIARVGVAVGIGMAELSINKPSHLGIDKAVYAGTAVEAATGAVATWPTTV